MHHNMYAWTSEQVLQQTKEIILPMAKLYNLDQNNSSRVLGTTEHAPPLHNDIEGTTSIFKCVSKNLTKTHITT